MKSNREYLDDFIQPILGELRNLKDFFRYGISDRILDWMEDDERPRKKGCLWPIIKWCVIICVLSTLFDKYPTNKTMPHQSSDSSTATISQTETSITTETYANSAVEIQGNLIETQPEMNSEEAIPGNLYDLVIMASQENVEAILSQEPIDLEALRTEYEFLLTTKTTEYLFKAYAYGNFTGEYDIERFRYLLDECETIKKQAVAYIPEEEINADMEFYIANATRAFRDDSFDYDSILIGSKDDPDVDAMWNYYIESTTGLNLQDMIDAYSGNSSADMKLAIPEPTTGVSIEPDVQSSDSSKGDTAENTYLEGYVMYDTGGLNIRNGPGVSYEQIGRLPEGECVVVLETCYSGTAQWGRIERGWVCMDYIQIGSWLGGDRNGALNEVREMDFFTVSFPASWSQKYALEHNYTSSGEYLAFYDKTDYEFCQYSYPNPAGWMFAIAVRHDSDTANAIAGWEPIGIIKSVYGNTYNLYIHYPIDPQFMDSGFDEYITDAHSAVSTIVAKENYMVTLYN